MFRTKTYIRIVYRLTHHTLERLSPSLKSFLTPTQSQRLTVEDQTPRRSSRSGSVGSVGARSGSQEPSEKTTPKGAPAKATPKGAPTRATPKTAATKATPNTATKASGKKQRGGSKNLQPQVNIE